MESLAVRKHRISTAGLRSSGLCHAESAQSLIEVAVMMPIFILLFCYAVDFGYFFIVASSLTSSARNAVAYSTQGPSSVTKALPPAGGLTVTDSVASLARADISGFLNASVTTSVFVCSGYLGLNPDMSHKCQSYGASTLNYTPDVDPESAMFQLNRVDVVYTITPPIPLGFMPSGVAPTSMDFHRMAEMREID